MEASEGFPHWPTNVAVDGLGKARHKTYRGTVSAAFDKPVSSSSLGGHCFHYEKDAARPKFSRFRLFAVGNKIFPKFKRKVFLHRRQTVEAGLKKQKTHKVS